MTVTESADHRPDGMDLDQTHTRVRPRIIQAQQGDSTRLRATRVRGDEQAGPVPAGADAPEHTIVRRAAGNRPTDFGHSPVPVPAPPVPVGGPAPYAAPAGPVAPQHTLVQPPPTTPARRWLRAVLPLTVAAALVAGIVVVVVVRGTEPPPLPDASVPTSAVVVPLQAVPAPDALSGRADGADVVFAWTNPEPLAGDVFRWRRTDVVEVGRWQDTDLTEVRIAGVSRACIEVELVRADARRSTTPSRSCFPSEG